MNLSHIMIINRYESKIFCRSWIFRIFAVLSLLGISTMLFRYFAWSGERWLRTALSAHIPYFGVYLYGILQAIIVIFWSGGSLKRDKKLDTVDVFRVRPVTNADFLAGRVLGVIKVCFVWNVLTLLCIAFLHLFMLHSPFTLYPYILYLFAIGLPSLIFMLGLSCLMMGLLKNQALAFIILLGVMGILLYYLPVTGHGVLDLFCSGIPAILSDITGHADLGLFLFQRLIFCLAGVGFLCFTVALSERLPQRRRKVFYRFLPGGVFVVLAIVAGGLYLRHFGWQTELRNEYIAIFNRYAGTPRVQVAGHELTVTLQGKRLEGSSLLKLKNARLETVPEVILYLNPALEVLGVECEGKSLDFKREQQVIRIDKTLSGGGTAEITVRYAGGIDESICYVDVPDREYWDYSGVNARLHPGKRYAWLEEKFTLLTPECIWYPVAAAPVHPAALYNLQKDFTDYKLTVCCEDSKTVLSQGKACREGNKTIFTNPIPLSGISLTLADYERKSLEVDSVLYEILYFPGHDTFSSAFVALRDSMAGFLREVRANTERDNGPYPFTKFVLAEIPAQFHAYMRSWKGTTEQVQPEIVLMSERAYIQNTDFKKEIHSQQLLIPQEFASPEFIEYKVLYGYIHRTFVPGGNLKESSPLYIFPMFREYTRYMYSDEYPVLDAVLNKLIVRKSSAMSLSVDPCINDRQRASYYLGSHSLKTAVTDRQLHPAILDELLELKARELENYIGTLVPLKDFRHFLEDFVGRHRFQTVSFAVFERELHQALGLSLREYLAGWYHKDRIPTIVFGEGETFRVVNGEDEKYQTRLKIYNPSGTDALVSLNMRAYNRKERYSEEYDESYVIPAGEARELRLMTYLPAPALTVSALSRNIPSEYRFCQAKDYGDTKDTAHGAFPIDPKVFGPEPGVIIVDNEDRGFRVMESGKSYRLKEMFQKKKDEKYQAFNRLYVPTQWTLTVGMTAYGESIRSAVYKKSGSGQAYAEWKAVLPEKGYYEVYVWNARMSSGGGVRVVNGVVMESYGHEQTYSVIYGEEKETFTIDLTKEQDSWILLGTFHMPRGEASVVLTDRSDAQFVTADAVKFRMVK